MTDQSHPLETLQDIKQMMERSSRFISLSGLSGIAAGACALAGAWFAHGIIANGEDEYYNATGLITQHNNVPFIAILFSSRLFQIAAFTFIAALLLAFLFTYLRSRKTNAPVWGKASRRLMVNMCIPLFVGGAFILKMTEAGHFGLIAPGCLIFYGLALVNAGKYTLSEVRYLGYCQLVIGLVSLQFVGYGLYFWALGFGVMHILYGIVMWWKYERKTI